MSTIVKVFNVGGHDYWHDGVRYYRSLPHGSFLVPVELKDEGIDGQPVKLLGQGWHPEENGIEMAVSLKKQFSDDYYKNKLKGHE